MDAAVVEVTEAGIVVVVDDDDGAVVGLVEPVVFVVDVVDDEVVIELPFSDSSVLFCSVTVLTVFPDEETSVFSVQSILSGAVVGTTSDFRAGCCVYCIC